MIHDDSTFAPLALTGRRANLDAEFVSAWDAPGLYLRAASRPLKSEFWNSK